jgi:hypothetical protein
VWRLRPYCCSPRRLLLKTAVGHVDLAASSVRGARIWSRLLGILAVAVVSLLAELARRKFNLSIEQSHRDGLQKAITNAAGLALNKLGNSLQGKTVDARSALLADAVNYVAKAAPDAMTKLGLSLSQRPPPTTTQHG